MATYNVAVLAGLGLVTVLFGPELIAIFASSRHAEANTDLPALVIAAFFHAAIAIPSKGLFLRRKTAYLLPLVLGSAGVNIGLPLRTAALPLAPAAELP